MSSTTTSLKSTQSPARNDTRLHSAKNDYKFCEHCQKTDHSDDECWSTRAVSPANEMTRWRVGRNRPLNIVYITTPGQFKAMCQRLKSNNQRNTTGS